MGEGGGWVNRVQVYILPRTWQITGELTSRCLDAAEGSSQTSKGGCTCRGIKQSHRMIFFDHSTPLPNIRELTERLEHTLEVSPQCI